MVNVNLNVCTFIGNKRRYCCQKQKKVPTALMVLYINTFADLNDLRSAEKERDDLERGIVIYIKLLSINRHSKRSILWPLFWLIF